MRKAISLLGLLMSMGITVAQTQTVSDKELKNEQKKIEQIEKLKKRHEKWDSCFIVKAKGDTIYGKVDHRDNQCSVLDGYLSSNIIFFAYAETEKQVQFIPNDIRELYVFNGKEEYRRYLTLADKYYVSDYGILYRIIVDGTCKLIAIKVSSSPENQPRSNIPKFRAARTTKTRPNTPIVIAADTTEAQLNLSAVRATRTPEEHYYIYYKQNRTQIKVEMNLLDSLIVINGGILFRKKCIGVFAECPSLVEKIEDKTYGPADIRRIVKEFNECIANNPATQTNK